MEPLKPRKHRNKPVQTPPLQYEMESTIVPGISRKITPEIICRVDSKTSTFDSIMGGRISPLLVVSSSADGAVAIPVHAEIAAAAASSSDEEVVYAYFPFKEPKPNTPSPISLQGSFIRDVEAQSPPRPEDAKFFPEDSMAPTIKPNGLWSMLF
jgi:hypothetical protein